MNLLLIPFAFAFFMLLILALAVLVFVFWLIILIDVVRRRFKSDIDKVVWVLVIIFANWIGALIYYFLVYRK